MDFYDAYRRLDRPSNRTKRKPNARQRGGEAYRERHFGDFTCRHCRRDVTSASDRSGVNNRNHCPYCLWSKHVDAHVSGDRLSACQGPMRPVGVSFKPNHKRYGGAQPGELLLVHQCADCGALSLNRVAADDLAALVWETYAASLTEPTALTAAALADGIALAGATEQALVHARLFGKSAELIEAG